MPTALKIEILNAAGSSVENTVLFQKYEILQGTVFPVDDVNIKRAQKGAPTMFILSDAWHELKIAFRIHGYSTLAKFTTIRNSLRAGKQLRVYPKYLEDESYYFECLADPRQFILESTTSGQNMANQSAEILFIQSNNQEIVMDDDIVVP